MLEFTLNDGNRIPALGFGTGTALYNKDASAFVRLAIKTGVTHLDGAQMYKNEETLGEGIKTSGKPRSELFITTKLHVLDPGQKVKETLVESLGKLGVDYVDLFLIHDPTVNQKEGTLPEIWSQLEALKTEGLAKSIGVSNFKVEDLNAILPGAKIVPAVNQVSRSCHH
jgi:diketogulonate reductase-like aldo/keto reductase